MKLSEDVKEKLEFFLKFFDRIKGRKDIKSRVAVLANPDNPKTMSVLTEGEARFVSLAYFLASNKTWGNMWRPIQKHAQELMETSPSIGGRGREETIRLVGALSETKLLSKLGLNIGKEGESEK